MDIIEYFDFIQIPSNSSGYAKPNKEIFHKTIDLVKKKYGQDGSHEFMHIGDNIKLDYEAAKSSGYKSLLMCHDDPKKLRKLELGSEILMKQEYAIDLLDLKEKIFTKF